MNNKLDSSKFSEDNNEFLKTVWDKLAETGQAEEIKNKWDTFQESRRNQEAISNEFSKMPINDLGTSDIPMDKNYYSTDMITGSVIDELINDFRRKFESLGVIGTADWEEFKEQVLGINKLNTRE